jgi:V/A-type H+/Na+-transporting ATPase subunit D
MSQQNIAPTKANLLKSKQTLAFSRRGFSLLDKKRNILIREMMSLVDRSNTIQVGIQSTFDDAFNSLRYANITLGSNTVNAISMSVGANEDYEVIGHSVMGVEIPRIKRNDDEKMIPYGLFRTNASLDRTVSSFQKARELIYELAEVENSVYKLATEIKKTQKRANALEKIQIPRYVAIVKYIMDALEEKEREDFFRLKKVKGKAKIRKELESRARS